MARLTLAHKEGFDMRGSIVEWFAPGQTSGKGVSASRMSKGGKEAAANGTRLEEGSMRAQGR